MTDGPEQEGARPQGAAPTEGTAPRRNPIGKVRIRAALATVAWTVLVGAYAIGFSGASSLRGTGFLDGAFFLLAWALPVLLIWLAAFLAEELVRQRDLVAGLGALAGPLREALEATRASLDRHPHAPRPPDQDRIAAEAETRGMLGQLAAGQTELAALISGLRQAPPAPAPAAAQPAPARPVRPAAPPPRPARAPSAAAAPQAEPVPEAEPELPWEDVVRAFDFPRDAEDAEGFRALKAALRRRSLAQMLQAAEDVLTILSQEGVFTDDFAPLPVDVAAWRRFLEGGRGEIVAAVGGVKEPAALETAGRLMKEDTVFRDTALFFLRRFDVALQEIAVQAEDGQIAALADTRSGRAFQLMARASGAFD